MVAQEPAFDKNSRVQKQLGANDSAKIAPNVSQANTVAVFDWPFQKAHALEVAGWGFWLAILGLILTIGGFSLTIWQLRKTRSAARAVEDKVKEVQIALVRYDLANEATRAASALSAARNYARAGMWANVADSYETFRSGLQVVIEEATEITDQQRRDIEAAIRYVDGLCKRIENGLEKGRLPDKPKTISVMRGHAALITQVRRVIEKGIIK